ncbi:MAG: polymorphic toxin type 17 domain-containing protein [Candidatus Berkiella sp.]
MKDHQELLAKKTCKAISRIDRAKVKACLELSTECLIYPGKWNPLHHALEESLYDWVKDIFKDVFMARWDRRQKSDPNLEFDNLLAEYSECAYDRYDRTLEYRLKRRDEKHRLDRELDRSTSWIDTIRGYDGLIDFTIKELGIRLVDSLHEKAVHTQKIQQNAISKRGQQTLMAGRSIGLLASAGPINFALSLAWIYGENLFRGRLYQAVGELGGRVAPLVGYSSESGRQYLPQIVDNTFSFLLMPQYYVASSILSSGVYYGFKDTGYDNAEAFAQLAVDAVAYSTTVSRGTAYKVDEQYRYNLKNYLTALPVVGESIAPWLTPLIASVDSFSNQFNEYVNYPVDALIPFYSKSSLMKLSELIPAPVRASFEAVKSFHQAKNALQQRLCNGFEGAALTLMNDSVFKQNRLHALQMFETQRLHAELNSLQNRLEQERSGKNRAGQVIDLERNIAQGVQALNASSELEHQLFKQTEGCPYFEQWQAKYEQLKLAQTDKTVTKERKSTLQAEVVELKKKADFYNNASINKWGEIWANNLDEMFTKNAANFIDATNIPGAINQIINKAFSEGGDRNGIARVAANEVMRYRYPLGYTSDNPQTSAERQALIDEISTNELAGFNRNPHRSKNRLYDYIYAKLSNTPKKPHIPRHERILKPFVNEILGKTIGVIPFKDFKGGRLGADGHVGLQGTKSIGQPTKVDFTVAGTPVTRLRGDKKVSKMSLDLPKRQQSDLPVGKKVPETKIALDSPYMKEILAEQYQETFGNVAALGKVVTKKEVTKEEPLGKVVPKKAAQDKNKYQKAIDNLLASPATKKRKVATLPELDVPLLTRVSNVTKKSYRTEKQSSSVGQKLLGYVVKDAEACAGVIGGAMGATEISIAGIERKPADVLAAKLSAAVEAINQEEYSLPPILQVTKGVIPYFGTNPNKRASDIDSTSFPAVSSSSNKIKGRALVPVSGLSSYTFPLLVAATPLFYEYRTNKDPEGWSKKGRMKAQCLPNEGKIRYIPPKKYNPQDPLPRGPNNGFYDNFKNEWVKGPSRTQGEPFEWDIQLSEVGKKQLGWASRDQKHLNVSLKGKITHR